MKENAVAINEYDMIGAELYYFYSYFDNVKKIGRRITNLNNKINNIKQQISEYSSSAILDKNIDWIQYPEIQIKYNSFCENRCEILKNELYSLKKQAHKMKNAFILGIVFLIIAILIPIIHFCMCFKYHELFVFTAPSVVVALILGGIASIPFHTEKMKKREKTNRCISDFIHELDSLEQPIDFNNQYQTEIMCNVLNEIKTNDVIAIFRKYNPDFFSNLEQEKMYYERSMNEYKLVLNSIKNEFKENMFMRNTIIPSVYHTEEDVTNLIDYYVRKRGDTWKELVNEYEHDKKLNLIISSINDLSNQVSVLANGVVKCFNIVGMQLGIINQSILSLQTATQINLNKISQIENQQEKRLCELASSVQNMNLKTKVIIEGK